VNYGAPSPPTETPFLPPLNNILAMMIVWMIRVNSCSVPYCVTQLCTTVCTLIWESWDRTDSQWSWLGCVVREMIRVELWGGASSGIISHECRCKNAFSWMSVYLYVSPVLLCSNFWKPWPTNSIFGIRVCLLNIWVRFVCHGHWVEVKVTGTKQNDMGI